MGRRGIRGIWTPEKEDQLRALWATKLLVREIGVKLGCSKNAVLSKSRTMGLPFRRPDCRRDAKAQLTSKFKVPAVIKKRKCLHCRKEFQSDGNFRCDSCLFETRVYAPIAEGFAL